MVFDGPWRRRRPQYPDDSGPAGYGPYDEYGGRPGYGGPYRRGFRPYGGGYGYGRNSSCLRDLFFLDVGCCAAESLGCGPNLLLVAPSALRRAPSRARPAAGPRQWLVQRLLALIAAYQQQVSPRRPACCRFSPTCSHYAAEALRVHGLRRGLWLAARRLLRCRPGARGGDDPVPRSRG